MQIRSKHGQSQKANLLLTNARILYPARIAKSKKKFLSDPSTVAIRGDKILAVGGKELLEDCHGPVTQIVDCQNGTLMPGFNDAHCHILAYASSLLYLDVSPRSASSIEDIKALIKKKAAMLKPGDWITASGYDEFRLLEKRHPLSGDLDEAAPQNPVRLIHRTGYACVLNSLAMKLMNITVNTGEPEDGYIDRDTSGEPNGLLFGMKDYLEIRLDAGLLESREINRVLSLANKNYLAWGITSLQDATASNDIKRWNFFHKIKNEGLLRSRVTFMPGYRHVNSFLEAGFSPKHGDINLRLGPVKIVANMASGRLYPEARALEEIIKEMHRKGFQIALHSLEVETLEAGLEAINKALRENPRTDHRHRIEHCSICPPELIVMIRDAGLMVVSQPSFIYYNGDRYLSYVPQEQVPWLYPIGSLHRQGIKVAFSSDAPVAAPDPVMGLYASVARLAVEGKDITPLELVTLPEAMQMYTYNGAYASFEEKVKGSIEAGKLADLVLLRPGPLETGLKNIRDVKMLLTVLGGEIVYEGH